MKNEESHLIQDDITGDWIIVAPGRRFRPDGMKKKRGNAFAPNAIEPERILATYGRGENRMTVVSNLFPIFRTDSKVSGRQEIVIEGAKIMPFWNASIPRISALIDAFVERFRVLRGDKSIRYIQGFKNEGLLAGASQPHPHSQIFAVSFVPERLRDEAVRRKKALKRLGMTSHAHALAEATSGRIVFSDKTVVAFTNPTARFAYEVRIMTRRRIDNITQTTPAERSSLARAIHALLPLMKLRKLSYNFFFHDVIDERDEHFEIRFVPRAQLPGGFELDAGVYINPVPPEIASGEYRKAKGE